MERFLTDREYKKGLGWYAKLGGLRSKIARYLRAEGQILDIGTGHGHFAIAVAKEMLAGQIISIDVAVGDVKQAKAFVLANGLQNKVKIQLMDATTMNFPNNSFDFVINFLGLEDIHALLGEEGLVKAVRQMVRVLKPGGKIAITLMPPKEMETPAQQLDVRIQEYIGQAKWFPRRFYVDLLRTEGIKVLKSKEFYTGRKLTASQAKQLLYERCAASPKIYSAETPKFNKVWNLFGHDIQKYGLGYYSKVVVVIGQKVE